jgi:hypothetical protein
LMVLHDVHALAELGASPVRHFVTH